MSTLLQKTVFGLCVFCLVFSVSLSCNSMGDFNDGLNLSTLAWADDDKDKDDHDDNRDGDKDDHDDNRDGDKDDHDDNRDGDKDKDKDDDDDDDKDKDKDKDDDDDKDKDKPDNSSSFKKQTPLVKQY